MNTYIYAFLFCGFVCMISQLILDNTKLTPGHVTSLFVIIGVFSLYLLGIKKRYVPHIVYDSAFNDFFKSITR